jgi:phosphonate utilization transcriptional regulator
MTPPEPLEILRTHSLQNLVQEELERMILDGRLAPGEPLRETSLAALLGVSRGPIREAFRGLEEKGLVRVEKNHGVQVRTLSLEEADQIYEVRICLEVLIGHKVADNIGAAGLKEVKAIVKKMGAAALLDDVNPYTSLNLAFHDALARHCGNAKLHESYSRLVAQLSLYRPKAYLHDKNSMALSLSEHRAIFDAVERRNGGQASELLQRHAEDSRQRLHQAIQS